MSSDIQEELEGQRTAREAEPAKDTEEDLILVPAATRSIVVGLTAFPLLCIPMVGSLVSILTAAGAIGFALSAMRVIAREPDTYTGMLRAQIGLAIGVLGVVYWLGMMALIWVPALTS